MNEIWNTLSPCFIISTGRTGTKFLMYFFKRLSSDIDARHEPAPNILKLKWQFGAGKIELEKAVKIYKKIYTPIYRKVKKPLYIEASPQLRFLIPIINKVFQTYKIVYIIRDGRDWVRSVMNRGIYSSLIDKLPLPIINILRIVIPYNLWMPNLRYINFRAYLRDIWRFSIEDFKDEQYFKKWKLMSRFEKISWMWNKFNILVYEQIQNNPNAIVIRFEDIFDKENGYKGFYQIIKFLNLENFLNNANINLDEVFSEKINISRTYAFPHWNDWNLKMLNQFNEIAGNTMKLYGFL